MIFQDTEVKLKRLIHIIANQLSLYLLLKLHSSNEGLRSKAGFVFTSSCEFPAADVLQIKLNDCRLALHRFRY